MPFKLRPYQQTAVDKTINYVKRNVAAVLLELATGAGKSLIVAKLAEFFAGAAPHKKVLCIAPSKELVEQNAEKYRGYGYHASIYCASAGSKCMRAQVIFGSPQSLANNIDKIAHVGVSAIIIDEAHGMTETIKNIIESVTNYEIKESKINKNCRIIGLTATPYRMNTGYIYAIDASQETDQGDTVEVLQDETQAIEPYFNKLIYRITAGQLVADKFLSNVKIGDHGENYDTSELKTDSFGKFSAESVRNTFDNNSKTERIMQDVIAMSENKMGVMIFAATIDHANEINAMLPPGESCVVTGKTKKKDRQAMIEAFKAREIKYLVNVSVLTTGFDAPHVDMVAILRATESAMLFQQIIGRGLRLHDDKEHCLILDYAENIKRHGLESDIFTPEIRARKQAGESYMIDVVCPGCNAMSEKKRRTDEIYAGLAHNIHGNLLISGSEKVVRYNEDREPCEWEGIELTMEVLDPSTKDDFGDCGFKKIPIPAHYARRCNNPEAYKLSGKPIPCEHRYSVKTCPECLSDNDISARKCGSCNIRLVDPNEKLVEKAGQAGVIALGETKEVAVYSCKFEPYVSMGGNNSLKTTYNTEIGKVIAYHSKKQHWIFNKLAKSNNCTNLNSVDLEYKICEKWNVYPSSVKVKKTAGQNGYAKFEIKSVEFAKVEVEKSRTA